MYRELAADDINNILKNRALFLKYIYDIHTDKEVDNYNISIIMNYNLYSYIFLNFLYILLIVLVYYTNPF